jgi:S1-C subfamily serine protease
MPAVATAANDASKDVAEHAELRRQGAKAAVRGESRDVNPMRDPINQPDSTGESQHVWTGRRDAWESGHDSQQWPLDLQIQAASRSAANERAEDEAIFGVTRVLTFSSAHGLTSASGFFFERDDRLYLVSSRHVLFDGPSDHQPDRIEIDVHTDSRDLTSLSKLSILLYRDGVARWHQACDSGGEVDVATLELDRTQMPAGCAIRAFGPRHLAASSDQFDVGARLAIPGFPLGFFDTLHHLPVVRQASIASYYGVRFQGLGFFLTDARMHRGSSGSPVLSRREGARGDQPRWCLLGVHSSRMDMASRDSAQDESLGLNCAWYADVLMALTEASR